MSSGVPKGKNLEELKWRVHSRLTERVDFSRVRDIDAEAMRRDIRRVIEHLLDTEEPLLNRLERERLIDEVLDEILGFGPLEPLLKDPAVTDILVLGPHAVYVERRGRREQTEVRFRDNDHLLQVIDRMVARVGRRVDEGSPMVEARLPDGSRMSAVIPPIAVGGPTLCIRRSGPNPLPIEDLLNARAFTPEMAIFMEACVKIRANVLVSGRPGSGKTTLLNVLGNFLPHDERVVTVEDFTELRLRQDYTIPLEPRPPNVEGKGGVSARDCVRHALRNLSPDRLVIDELRGPEAWDVLQAADNTPASVLASVSAANPLEACVRLETMLMMAGPELQPKVLRRMIHSGIDVIIQTDRLSGGVRRVTRIVEVLHPEQEFFTTQEIYRYRQLGIDPNGRAIGQFEGTGVWPMLLSRLDLKGIELPQNLFAERVHAQDAGSQS